MGRAADFEAPSSGQSQLPWGSGGEIAASVLSPWGVGASRGSWGPEEAPAGCRGRRGETGRLQVPSRPGAPRLYALEHDNCSVDSTPVPPFGAREWVQTFRQGPPPPPHAWRSPCSHPSGCPASGRLPGALCGACAVELQAWVGIGARHGRGSTCPPVKWAGRGVAGRSPRRRAGSAAPVSGAAAPWGHVRLLRGPGPRDHLRSASCQSLGVRRPGSSLLLSSGADLEQGPRGPPDLTRLAPRTPQLAWVPLLDHGGDKSCPMK